MDTGLPLVAAGFLAIALGTPALVAPHRRIGRAIARAYGPASQVWRVERRMFGLMRSRKRQLAAVGVGIIVVTAVSTAGPWPTKILVDNVLEGRPLAGLSPRGALTLSVALTFGLLAVQGLIGIVNTRVQWSLAQGLTQDLRQRLFGHLTRLGMGFHDERTAGDTIYRVTRDTYSMQSLLVQGAIPLVSSLLRLFSVLVIMLLIDVRLAILSVLGAPLAVVVSARFKSRIKERSLDVARTESAVVAHTEQTMSGMRTVQAFAREQHEFGRFAKATEESTRAFVDLITAQTIFKLAIDVALGLGLAAVTWAAASRALAGQVTTGEVLVFLAYSGQLYAPLSALAGVFGQIQTAAVGAERVFEVLDAPTIVDVGGEPPRSRALGRLEMEEVTFSYAPGRQVLHGVSMNARPGQLVALVGPTGAGKSTIASMLMRLYDPQTGRVTLDGQDVRELPLTWLREQVALVPQDPVLFPTSVRENIRYGRLDATDEEVEDAARAANLYDELMADERGLDAPLGDRGVTLSGGQRQRVAIARAFLKGAPVIVLDEPTSALDASTEAAVMDAVARLSRGRTTIVIAHRLSTVERADQVLVVEDGRIVQSGTHNELMAEAGKYAELHRARFGSEPRLKLVGGASIKQSGPAAARRPRQRRSG